MLFCFLILNRYLFFNEFLTFNFILLLFLEKAQFPWSRFRDRSFMLGHFSFHIFNLFNLFNLFTLDRLESFVLQSKTYSEVKVILLFLFVTCLFLLLDTFLHIFIFLAGDILRSAIGDRHLECFCCRDTFSKDVKTFGNVDSYLPSDLVAYQ